MAPRERLVVAACASLIGACGYPDFSFAPAEASDSSVDDVAADSSSADTRVDAFVDAHDGASDTGVVADTIVDAPADIVVIESGVDAPSDVVAVDTFETSIDAGDAGDAGVDASPTCAPIDDMEDKDGYILVRCGRTGSWYTYNDGTGAQVPAPGIFPAASVIVGGRGASMYAMNTTGSGFTSWGAGIGFNFIDGGPSWDASAWGGVQFWARSESGAATVRLDVPERDTDGRGGVCNAAPGGCGDHFGKAIALTTSWTLFTVKWTDLAQEGWGYVAPSFDTAAVYGMQWQIDAGSPFDVWIDDVAFVP